MDPSAAQTVFLLSPAHCGGRRAQLLLNERAAFDLAVALRGEGAPLGVVFTFLSGLYFRGKLAYSRAFSRRAGAENGVLVILPGRGLVPPETIVTLEELRAIASVGVSPDVPAFRDPLARDAATLSATLGPSDRAVLLGSIATGKYVDILADHLAAHLRFPAAFVGRGDMSRGGLMLRCVSDRQELDYVLVDGATRRGPRPPKLAPLR